jgi:putative nucleotidyltransferase with HDIG domain
MAREKWRTGISAAAGSLFGALLVSVAWTADAKRRDEESALIHRALVDLLLNALSAGDAVTERHSRRVADLTDVLATEYGLADDRHSALRVAALLHDMGKIDDRFFAILHSCAPLSAEDRAKINQHPHESAQILEPLEKLHPGIMKIVSAHHECWDGNGYPEGLRREEIPLESRLISVADVFDAITQPRAYKRPLSVEEALVEIRRGSGSRFDPQVVDQLRKPRVIRRCTEILNRGRAEERAEELASE